MPTTLATAGPDSMFICLAGTTEIEWPLLDSSLEDNPGRVNDTACASFDFRKNPKEDGTRPGSD